MDNRWLADAVKSSSIHPYASKEGCETLEQQYMCLSLQHGILFPMQRGGLKVDILHKFVSYFW